MKLVKILKELVFCFLLCWGLISCSGPVESQHLNLKSPRGLARADIYVYSAGRDFPGYIIVSFNGTMKQPSFTINQIRNGIIGWRADGTFVVIGDAIAYRAIASSYRWERKERVPVVVCVRGDMDCGRLDLEMKASTNALRVAAIPTARQ